MKTTISLLTLLICFSSGIASASIKGKPVHKQTVTNGTSFRNAFTDVSLTKLARPVATSEEYAPINLAYMPEEKDGKHVSTYHGKHVTGAVFLTLALVFLFIGILFARAAKDRSNAAEATLGIEVCAAGFLGFGIPGTILMIRYPHSKPKVAG